jgi:dephospho-CoA kinase
MKDGFFPKIRKQLTDAVEKEYGGEVRKRDELRRQLDGLVFENAKLLKKLKSLRVKKYNEEVAGQRTAGEGHLRKEVGELDSRLE